MHSPRRDHRREPESPEQRGVGERVELRDRPPTNGDEHRAEPDLLGVSRYGEAGPGTPGTAMTVSFQLDGQGFIALNGGPRFPFTEAISLSVACETQAEVDQLWDALTADGEEVMCGWLKDRFGLSWQIIPADFARLVRDPDKARAARVLSAMMTMGKIDLAAIHAAAA